MPLLVSARGKRFMALPQRSRGFSSRSREHAGAAAKAATAESRLMYSRWHSGRPLAPPRRGRPTTDGQFANYLQWQANSYGLVNFELAALAARAPYWVIQEIGSGRTARILNPPGGVAVRSQIGRKLPYGFYWADAAGGAPTAPTGPTKRDIPSPFASPGRRVLAPPGGLIGQQQLFAAPTTGWRGSRGSSPGRIRREIKGKHFIQAGGREGFAVLSEQLLADFNKTFR